MNQSLIELPSFDGEKISNADGSAFGFVSSDGWQSDQSTLKIKNVIGTFSDDDVIIGSDSNSKATVDQIFDFDFNISVGSIARCFRGKTILEN